MNKRNKGTKKQGKKGNSPICFAFSMTTKTRAPWARGRPMVYMEYRRDQEFKDHT